MTLKLTLIILLFLSSFCAFTQENALELNTSQNLPQDMPSITKETLAQAKPDESDVFLDFRETDIRDVARVLSKLSGVSIIVSDDVKAKVTLNIEGLSWIKALQLILKAYNLAYVKKDNFIIILTYQRLKKEEEDAPLETKIITLNFVDIRQAKTYLSAIKSKRGNIEGDLRTNSLIVTDTPEAVERIVNIVNK